MRRLFLLGFAALLVIGATAAFPADSSLRLLQTVSLEGAEGRLDHFSVDVKGERLFVSALGNDSVEVIDLRGGKRVQTLRGMHKPSGVLYVPERNRLYVANSEDGSLKILHGSTFDLIKSIKELDDADNLRYDANTRLVYVGYGSGALAVIDSVNEAKIADLKLKAHPESFQLQKEGKRIFANVPNARQIAIVDRQRREQVAAIPMEKFQANFPMALDEAGRCLFIACRQPARLLVFDPESGLPRFDLGISGDADDLFFDSRRKRIYVSCGEGFINVIEQSAPDKYELSEKIPTSPGARTSFFSPELNRFFLGVPHEGQQNPEVRIYEPR